MIQPDLPAVELADLMLRYQQAHSALATRMARIATAQ